jgi:hydroxymethylbilane synthase
MAGPIRIGTRASKLALAQAEELRARLAAADPSATFEIVPMRTTGDRETRPLREAGGKGLFVKELDDAVLSRRVDLAVHSMKDVPSERPDGLALAALLPREDPRDAVVGELKEGATVGTSSPRRKALLLCRRPDLRIVEFRGNVDTRLAKVAAGEVDATLLAIAGLKRLGRADAASRVLDTDEFLPAGCQGAVGVECRADDAPLRALLAKIDDPATAVRVTAERALLATLGGSCFSPVAALAEIDGERLSLRGQIANPDGTGFAETRNAGALADADELGRIAGAALRRRAMPAFFA